MSLFAKKWVLSNIWLLLVMALLVSCSSSKQVDESPNGMSKDPTSLLVMANSLSFSTGQLKHIVVSQVGAKNYVVFNDSGCEQVLSGELSTALAWSPAGNERYQIIDVSSISQPGSYRVEVEDVTQPIRFKVDDEAFFQLHDAALKSFYFNRASQQLLPEHAGSFAREAGHLDLQVVVHDSAASDSRPAGTMLQSSKGWYDAGDFGKYVVNSGISTYTLLAAFDHHKEFYRDRTLNIPESNDSIPDILNEVLWNLEWLLTMQDADGGVSHKLTTLGWPGIEMPNEDVRTRFIIGKSTSASLNFAATMAYASRVFERELGQLNMHQQWLQAALAAWRWAEQNPTVYYRQPNDVESGEYGDDKLSDEFSWAAAELYLATEQQEFLTRYIQLPVESNSPSWQNIGVLPLISILNSDKQELLPLLLNDATSQLVRLADSYLAQYQNSVFKVAMVEEDFVWGSNSVALNKAWVLVEAYKATGTSAYRDAAVASVDYLLGKNPLAKSFITGFGENQVLQPHHRASAADSIEAPIPGMLAGGPQPGKQDKCDYEFSSPAKTYVDEWCSYATNEVAINWNAPLVYMLAFKISQL